MQISLNFMFVSAIDCGMILQIRFFFRCYFFVSLLNLMLGDSNCSFILLACDLEIHFEKLVVCIRYSFNSLRGNPFLESQIEYNGEAIEQYIILFNNY